MDVQCIPVSSRYPQRLRRSARTTILPSIANRSNQHSHFGRTIGNHHLMPWMCRRRSLCLRLSIILPGVSTTTTTYYNYYYRSRRWEHSTGPSKTPRTHSTTDDCFWSKKLDGNLNNYSLHLLLVAATVVCIECHSRRSSHATCHGQHSRGIPRIPASHYCRVGKEWYSVGHYHATICFVSFFFFFFRGG